MIKRTVHVGLSVANLDRSIGFYRDLFAMNVEAAPAPFSGPQFEAILRLPRAAGRVALLSSADFRLELFEFSEPRPRAGDLDRPVCDHGITHFCIEVADVRAEYERLSAAGVRFHCPPLAFFGTTLAAYGRDPDGNVFELVSPIEHERDSSERRS